MEKVDIKTRPIIMQTQSVRSILDGCKTQTRRVIKPQPPDRTTVAPCGFSGTGWAISIRLPYGRIGACSCRRGKVQCPYGTVGDRLYVREKLRVNGAGTMALYAADGLPVMVDGESKDWQWKRKAVPSIHMPRWASRLTLEITDIRVERVQEISEADILAEGLREGTDPMLEMPTLQQGWRYLWNKINAKRGYSWESNPWVWCVSFRRVEP